MGNHIIDSIGPWGVKTTPFNDRWDKPRPGDPVYVGHLTGYPFLDREYAYISSIDEGRASLCIGSCSMHLFEDGSLSVSGGPFTGCDLSELEGTTELRTTLFWNWGDNSPGAGQGVDYLLPRPVFHLNRTEEEDSDA